MLEQHLARPGDGIDLERHRPALVPVDSSHLESDGLHRNEAHLAVAAEASSREDIRHGIERIRAELPSAIRILPEDDPDQSALVLSTAAANSFWDAQVQEIWILPDLVPHIDPDGRPFEPFRPKHRTPPFQKMSVRA